MVLMSLSSQEIEMQDNLWGEIKLINWESTPHMNDKVAEELDVQTGKAVFFIDTASQDHYCLDLKIPNIVYQIDKDTGQRQIVIVIQAEQVNEKQLIGVRYLKGGNGMCQLSDIELINDDDLKVLLKNHFD